MEVANVVIKTSMTDCLLSSLISSCTSSVFSLLASDSNTHYSGYIPIYPAVSIPTIQATFLDTINGDSLSFFLSVLFCLFVCFVLFWFLVVVVVVHNLNLSLSLHVIWNLQSGFGLLQFLPQTATYAYEL